MDICHCCLSFRQSQSGLARVFFPGCSAATDYGLIGDKCAGGFLAVQPNRSVGKLIRGRQAHLPHDRAIAIIGVQKVKIRLMLYKSQMRRVRPVCLLKKLKRLFLAA